MKCLKCGLNSHSPLCWKCKPKPLLKSKGLSSKPFITKKKTVNAKLLIQKQEKNEELRKFFISLWNKRKHCSEISNEFLGHTFSTIYQHHILSKFKYPELALKEDNIIFLTFIEHQQVESDMYRYEEINKRRQQLKIKYNIK